MVVPQSFTFLKREALPRRGADLELDERKPRYMQNCDSDQDIFCLLKMNMSDEGLSQKPLLVYPSHLVPESEHFWNRVNVTDKVIQPVLEEARRAEIAELATAISKDFPSYGRAVDFYRKMLNPGEFQPYSPIKFLHTPKANARFLQMNLGERPPPPKPHFLQVVFHRQ